MNRPVERLCLVLCVLLSCSAPAHDGEHDEDGSYLSHLPYEEVSSCHLTSFKGQLVHRLAAPLLRRMWEHGETDGIHLVLVSGFRGMAHQRRLFYKDAQERPLREIARTTAPPGHSEHHTGLAFDFDDGNDVANLEQRFRRTQAGQWLFGNAKRFGLYLSFPDNNAQGISYEPWHYFMKDLYRDIHPTPSCPTAVERPGDHDSAQPADAATPGIPAHRVLPFRRVR